MVWARAGGLQANVLLLVQSVVVTRKWSFLEQAEVAVVSLVTKMCWHCLYQEWGGKCGMVKCRLVRTLGEGW